MHIILYKHTSHYIHYQLSQNTHSQSQTVAIMTALKNSLILITLCLGLAAAHEDAGEARLLFSNYTSGISNTILWKTLKKVNSKTLKIQGLLKLTTVNSTTYGLISLIVGGAALAIAFGYLITVSPTFQSQFQSQYRSFNDGEKERKK